MRVIAAMTVLLFIATTFAMGDESLTASAIFKKVSPSVVTVLALGDDGDPIAQGSGVVISADGHVATNYHVVRNSDVILLRTADGKEWKAEGWTYCDPVADLFVLKFPKGQWQTVHISERLPDIGADVYAIGSPKGLDQSLSEGLISGIRRVGTRITLIQTTAAIAPGSSGGALVDDNGQLLGLTTLRVLDADRLGFAIPLGDEAFQQSISKMPTRPFDHLPGYWIRRAAEASLEEYQKFASIDYEIAVNYFGALAQAYVNVGDLETAENYAKQKSKTAGDDYWHTLRAIHYARHGDIEAALELVSEHMGRGNELPESMHMWAIPLLNISIIASEYDLPDYASRSMQMASQVSRSMQLASQVVIGWSVERARLALCQSLVCGNRLAEAEALARRTKTKYYYIALAASGQHRNAQDHLKSHFAAESEQFADTCQAVAEYLIESNDMEAAVNWLAMLPVDKPNVELALLLARAGQKKEASAILELCIENAPDLIAIAEKNEREILQKSDVNYFTRLSLEAGSVAAFEFWKSIAQASLEAGDMKNYRIGIEKTRAHYADNELANRDGIVEIAEIASDPETRRWVIDRARELEKSRDWLAGAVYRELRDLDEIRFRFNRMNGEGAWFTRLRGLSDMAEAAGSREDYEIVNLLLDVAKNNTERLAVTANFASAFSQRFVNTHPLRR